MTRAFPGVIANDQVDLVLRSGEIHALLGENGAGKSTLVKMIYGVLRPDAGEMRWMGQPVEINSPAEARKLGIGMVFQHFSLFDSLTVLDNIFLGIDSASDRSSLREQIRELSRRYGLPLDPDRHVYTLSVGERQRIEIIRCLLQEPRLLIMDEPTSVLTPQEVEGLFETLRQLAAEGVSILYISHKLNEIVALCEHATILRGGKVVDSVAVANETPSSLAGRMVGEQLASARLQHSGESGDIRLEVQHLTMPAQDAFGVPLRDISFSVRAGEILGIAGVAGNGQDELLRALGGEVRSANDVAIRVDDKPCASEGPNRRRKLGLATIPEQRIGHGAVPDMTLTENIFLTGSRRLGLSNSGIMRFGAARRFANAVIDRFKVRSGRGAASLAGTLSGGNLQKFIVGREIDQTPHVLVVSQPTWGVDAGSARFIHESLRDMASRGAAVVVISQDLDELLLISDRIAAICGGELSNSYPVSGITAEQVGLMMAGSDPLAEAS